VTGDEAAGRWEGSGDHWCRARYRRGNRPAAGSPGRRVVLGSRSEEELAAADAVAGSGGEVAYQCIDVTQPGDLRGLVDLAAHRFGRLDVLPSVAGVSVNAPLSSGELDDWNRMIDVNLRGVLHGIAAVLPVFRTQGSGHFITVASTAAYEWVPGQAVYAATKSAVRALCEVMRQELAPMACAARSSRRASLTPTSSPPPATPTSSRR
jgi:NADP-dependent 3-hydroxy acid dehydrogenase YdfG